MKYSLQIKQHVKDSKIKKEPSPPKSIKKEPSPPTRSVASQQQTKLKKLPRHLKPRTINIGDVVQNGKTIILITGLQQRTGTYFGVIVQGSILQQDQLFTGLTGPITITYEVLWQASPNRWKILNKQ